MPEELISHLPSPSFTLRIPERNERRILKAFLLERFHHLFHELFDNLLQSDPNYFLTESMECYVMDSKIIQLLIQEIVETGEYTLEGIAFYTRIPFDIIYEAACGFGKQFSITPWAKVVELYIQVKPDVAEILIDKLLMMKEKNHAAIACLLSEG